MSEQVEADGREAVDAEMVVSFLRQHPDFLSSQLELLRELEVPHIRAGKLPSLIERQVRMLGTDNGRLQREIKALLGAIRDNQALSEKMHRLSVELIGCREEMEVVAALEESLRGEFGIEQVLVLLPHRFDEERRQLFAKMMHDSVPFCGQLEEPQRHALFGEDMEHGASVALLPIGSSGSLGLIALGSSDPQHYHDQMGTHFLNQLAELAVKSLISLPSDGSR